MNNNITKHTAKNDLDIKNVCVWGGVSCNIYINSG